MQQSGAPKGARDEDQNSLHVAGYLQPASVTDLGNVYEKQKR